MAVEEFNLFWSNDPDVLPNASAFKLPHSKRYQALEDALEQAKMPPNTKDKHPWIEADGLLFSPGHIRVLNEWRDNRKGRS